MSYLPPTPDDAREPDAPSEGMSRIEQTFGGCVVLAATITVCLLLLNWAGVI